jgi:Ulp1 family protease
MMFQDSTWYRGKLGPATTQFVESARSGAAVWTDFKYIEIPINIDNSHWILLHLDTTSKTIYYVDPQGSFQNEFPIKILLHMTYTHYIYREELGGAKEDLSSWTILNVCGSPSYPKQVDGSNCGVYICQISKALCMGLDPQLRSSDLQNFRRSMVQELQKQQLVVPINGAKETKQENKVSNVYKFMPTLGL